MSKVYPYIQPVYGQEEKDAVLRVFENAYFSGGKETVSFEKELATWWGSKFALSINSGSNSNFVALQALELPKGSEVITCASGAFPTTVNPIIILGYKPIFVDMTPDLKIDLDQVEKAITPKTKAIMFANFLGIMPDMDRLMAIIKKHNLKFVEDSCDAMGSTFKGKKSGLWGDIATCSFYPAHTMTTGGEGGAIITNNFALYRKALSYRDWGRDCYCQWGSEQPACKNQFSNPPFNHRYLYTRIGLNHKITEFQAAFGREQLKRVDGFIELRKRNYNILANILHTPTVSEVSPFAYPCFFENKEEAMIKLNEKGINTRVMFTGNLTKHPAYTKYKQDFPVADHLLKDGFFVGVGPHLSEEDMVFIGTTLSCL